MKNELAQRTQSLAKKWVVWVLRVYWPFSELRLWKLIQRKLSPNSELSQLSKLRLSFCTSLTTDTPQPSFRRYISNQSSSRSHTNISITHTHSASLSFWDRVPCQINVDFLYGHWLDTHCECRKLSICIPSSSSHHGRSIFDIFVCIGRNVKRPTIERFSLFYRLYIQ